MLKNMGIKMRPGCKSQSQKGYCVKGMGERTKIAAVFLISQKVRQLFKTRTGMFIFKTMKS